MPQTRDLRIALAQVNPTVGDLDGNAHLIREAIANAREAGADLVVLPELVVNGYPPEDLLLRPDFVAAGERVLAEIAPEAHDVVALVGYAEGRERTRDDQPPARNSLAVLGRGRLCGAYRKVRLPNYGVFDERRYFEPGTRPALIEVGGVLVGLTICEDLWVGGPPETAEAAAGASLVVNASGSPYHRGKATEREELFATRAREAGAAIALCNMVGGQDELVFDGGSVVLDADGEPLGRAGQFAEELLVVELQLPAVSGLPAAGDVELLARLPGAEDAGAAQPKRRLAEPLGPVAEVYEALVRGLRDYVAKNGFQHLVLALSGGIDSSLVALLACDAVGAENVSCVVMPSPHSSAETQADARATAANLGAELIEIPIETPMSAYDEALAPRFAGTEPDVAEENLQARIRGNLVMALSNKFGWLVLTTGNKSEMSVGYATLYGDMAGGFAVIKDVPKTLVYELVRDRNERHGADLVPASVLERPPSAELRPDQLDADSLPPYDLLDRILEAYVERDQGPDEIVGQGLPADVVARVVRMVDGAEYKRRQAAPGVKITPKAFGRDRRLPITNRWGAA